MPNSQLLLFYRTKLYLKFNAIASDWTNNTFYEIFEVPSKFSVKCLTKSVMMSPEQRQSNPITGLNKP